jgi:hypothetical protein
MVRDAGGTWTPNAEDDTNNANGGNLTAWSDHRVPSSGAAGRVLPPARTCQQARRPEESSAHAS